MEDVIKEIRDVRISDEIDKKINELGLSRSDVFIKEIKRTNGTILCEIYEYRGSVIVD